MVKFLLWIGIGLVAGGPLVQAQQSAPEEKKADAFFSGTVIESAPDRISVARRISGKQERRVFRVTPETKIDGKLQPKVRVTVQYTIEEDGSNTATRIVVHNASKK